MLARLLFLLIPVSLQVVLTSAGLIPYVGGFFQVIGPLAAFWIFIAIGQYTGETASQFSATSKAAFIAFAFVVCTLTFAAPYFVDYYAVPVRVVRNALDKDQVNMTYDEASIAVKSLLRREVGSDGVFANAVYSERRQLSGRSYGEYVSKQFEDVDDIGGLIAAGLNIFLHTIPLLLAGLLDKLGWVREAGFVGLGFWYLFSLILWKCGHAMSVA